MRSFAAAAKEPPTAEAWLPGAVEVAKPTLPAADAPDGFASPLGPAWQRGRQ